MKKLKERLTCIVWFVKAGYVGMLLSCLSFTAIAQKNVTGTVLDNKGETIIGATILEKGTGNGTATDIDGNFTLKVADNATLVVSFVGYISQEIQVAGRSKFEIVLAEDSKALEEVVVIGYGTVKKGGLTGAVAKVDANKLGDRPVTDVSAALQGQLAGVEVRTTSGEPGKDIQIRVRGAASINASADPLYVVNGVPQDNLNGVNPADIESIQVLKDASSSAIYGSRGANGVVLVTLKEGRSGKPQIEFSANWGVQMLESKMDLLSGEEWIEMKKYYIDYQWQNQTKYAGASADDSYEDRLNKIGSMNYEYIGDARWFEEGYGGLALLDWQDEFYRNAFMHDYQLSVSGGSETTNYRFSAGMLNQEGIATGTDFSRLNLRANVNTKLFDRVTVDMNIAPMVSWGNGGRVDGKDSQSHKLLSMVPVAEAEAGKYTASQPNMRYMWAGSSTSPVAYMEQSSNVTDQVRLNSSLSLKGDIWNGISAEVMGAWDYYSRENRVFIPTALNSAWNTVPEGEKSTGQVKTSRKNHMLFQALLNYNKEIGRHTISAMVGYSVEQTKSTATEQKASKFPNDALEGFDEEWTTISNSNFTINTPTRLLSYFGRVQYDFDSRYNLSVSLRRDGSSLFGSDAQWGWFPAISGAWRISNEKFWVENPVVSSLKIRGSWGANGNNSIPSNAALGILDNANYSFNGTLTSGFAPTSMVNADLGWEKTESYNVGLDLGMANNRLILALDYYEKKTKDLLYKVAVPAVTGYTTAWSNIGSIKNKGVELELTSTNLTGQFQWTTNFTMGYNQNEVVNLGENNETVYTGWQKTQALQVGQPLKSYYMYKAVGVYQTAEDLEKYPKMSTTKLGDVRYADVDGNGEIDEHDKTLVGNPSPDFTFGLTNRFNYKGFDLSVLVTAQTGGEIYGLVGRAIDRPGMGAAGNMLGRWRNMWKSEAEPGDGKTPSLFGTTGSLYDTRWLYSSDFIKIKNITLGYTIPTKGIQWLQYARVYASVENVFMWDKYDGGYSPESSNGGTGGDYDYGAYPQARTISFGVNLTF